MGLFFAQAIGGFAASGAVQTFVGHLFLPPPNFGVGGGDIEVGDPAFDDRWRVTAEEPEAAREVLTPGVWRLFASPQLPPFGQVWFERDVAAVVTEGPIAPESVDGYLRFLHNVMGAVAD